MVDDNGDDGSVSSESCKTHSDDSFRWADESDLSDAYVDIVEQLPLVAALPSNAQPPSQVIADLSSCSAPGTPGSGTPATETPALFDSSVSPPNAQPVCPSSDVYHSPGPLPSQSSQPDPVLDSQGLVKPGPPVSSSVTHPRISRCAPAPIPEALAAAAPHKPTTPSLVSGRSRSRASPSMDTSVDLKRKATQTETREKERKRRGRK